MDEEFYTHPPAKRRQTTINPSDLLQMDEPILLQAGYGADPCSPFTSTLNYQNAEVVQSDSAIDLTALTTSVGPSPPSASQEGVHLSAEAWDSMFLMNEYSNNTSNATSNAPSPVADDDFVFSQANSPGELFRDFSKPTSPIQSRQQSRLHSRQPSFSNVTNFLQQKSVSPEGPQLRFPDGIKSPLFETIKVSIHSDKYKTRAETQMKITARLDLLNDRFEYMRFPKKTLAKPKLLASHDESQEIEGASFRAVHMDTMLVCATAIEKDDDRDLALRRARGDAPMPLRKRGQNISDLDKDDPSHPRNGGEVLLCEGCRERERKRYGRKKKKADDETEWFQYEYDRVVMINEKEYKKLKPVEAGEQASPYAKQVEFAMRIACYCRHQEEKSPMGYRVIFTFKDPAGRLLAQHISEIFQITDDHKNKEVPHPHEVIPRSAQVSQPQPYPFMPNTFSQNMVVPPISPTQLTPTQSVSLSSPGSLTSSSISLSSPGGSLTSSMPLSPPVPLSSQGSQGLPTSLSPDSTLDLSASFAQRAAPLYQSGAISQIGQPLVGHQPPSDPNVSLGFTASVVHPSVATHFPLTSQYQAYENSTVMPQPPHMCHPGCGCLNFNGPHTFTGFSFGPNTWAS